MILSKGRRWRSHKPSFDISEWSVLPTHLCDCDFIGYVLVSLDFLSQLDCDA